MEMQIDSVAPPNPPPKPRVVTVTVKESVKESFMDKWLGKKRPRDETQANIKPINAIIYKWTFVPPDDMDHPLSGICYIGQTIQSLDARTKQHKSDARRDGKDLGLHALYVQHPDSWKIEIVEQQPFTGPQLNAKTAASEWMDDRERALIKEHGGKLKDMGRKLKQTLNLTDGGQSGDPRKRWQSIEAKTRKQWQEVEPLFDAFFKEHGHVNVSQRDKKNKKLGIVVHNIRSGKQYVTVCPEIKTYLEERNFIWNNVKEEHANIIKQVMLSYDNPNKTRAYVETNLDPALAKRWKMVRHDSEKDDEINIGNIISQIRSRGQFINNDPIFFEALIAKDFKMHCTDTKKHQERIAEIRELHRRARVGPA